MVGKGTENGGGDACTKLCKIFFLLIIENRYTKCIN